MKMPHDHTLDTDQAGVTGGLAGMTDRGPTGVAVAGPLTEFSTSETSGVTWYALLPDGRPVRVEYPRYVGILTDEGFYPSLVASGRERPAE